MKNSFVLGLRSIAKRELHNGHIEIGHVIDGAADHIERLWADKDVVRSQARNAAYESDIGKLRAEISRLKERIELCSGSCGFDRDAI